MFLSERKVNGLSKEKIFSKQAFLAFVFHIGVFFFPLGGKYQKISLCGKVAWEGGEASSANMLISNTTLERGCRFLETELHVVSGRGFLCY